MSACDGKLAERERRIVEQAKRITDLERQLALRNSQQRELLDFSEIFRAEGADLVSLPRSNRHVDARRSAFLHDDRGNRSMGCSCAIRSSTVRRRFASSSVTSRSRLYSAMMRSTEPSGVAPDICSANLPLEYSFPRPPGSLNPERPRCSDSANRGHRRSLYPDRGGSSR